MQARFNLNFISGPLSNESFSIGLGEEIVVGSDAQCGIVIQGDPLVARKHARIFVERGVACVEDLSRSGATVVNGKPIQGKTKLAAGDRIAFGKFSVCQGGWWNALEPSRFASVVAHTAAPSDHVLRRTTKSRGAKIVAKVFFATLGSMLLVVVGVWFVRPSLIASVLEGGLANKITQQQLENLAHKPQSSVSSTQHTPMAAQVERNFVWDEIVNVSRRFGDPPPSAMDKAFLKQVENWIEVFTKNDAHQEVLKRKSLYWPAVENALRAEGLPTELGYVVWVESGFQVNAKSGAGALGMWQFIPSTAKAFGLRVDSGVDERLDPAKSSKAAAKYFATLLKMFGSDRYLLAIASYNAGQNKVRRKQIAATIRKARQPDFWHLQAGLPKETVDYVPRVLAAMIVARNPERW